MKNYMLWVKDSCDRPFDWQLKGLYDSLSEARSAAEHDWTAYSSQCQIRITQTKVCEEDDKE